MSNYHSGDLVGIKPGRAVIRDQGLLDAQMYTFADEALQYFLKPPPTLEEKFRQLDVQIGDRVRLTSLIGQDASQLEGRVIGIKVKNKRTELRIDGFDHTGGAAGGQHVWFPATNYTVEVLHRAYRWTDDDRITAEVAGVTEKAWVNLSENNRDYYRNTHRERVKRIKKLLSA